MVDPNVALELQRKHTISSAALYTTDSDMSSNNRKFRGTCHWCQKTGHRHGDGFAKKIGDSRVPKEKTEAKSEKTPEANVVVEDNFALMAQDGRDDNSESWIVDSGASHHYTDNKLNIHRNYESVTGSILTAVSERLYIEAKGENESFGTVKYVPKIGLSLLSVGQLTDYPTVQVNFKKNECVITKEDKVVSRAIKNNDNLYQTAGEAVLNTQAEADGSTKDSSSESEDSDRGTEYDVSHSMKDWQHRLGHLSTSGIRHLVRCGKLVMQKRDLQQPLKCI